MKKKTFSGAQKSCNNRFETTSLALISTTKDYLNARRVIDKTWKVLGGSPAYHWIGVNFNTDTKIPLRNGKKTKRKGCAAMDVNELNVKKMNCRVKLPFLCMTNCTREKEED